MRISARIILALCLVVVTFQLSLLPVFAATTNPTPVRVETATSADDSFQNPTVEDNVPHNNHTYTQAVMIDVLSALFCQLAGIDPTNPKQSCLDYNAKSGKIGYATQPNDTLGGVSQNVVHAGGALGVIATQIGVVYTPTVSSSVYFHDLEQGFGIVKNAYAQTPAATQNCALVGTTSNAQGNIAGGAAATATPGTTGGAANSFGYGFCGLQPVYNIWKTSRDLSYMLLVLAFVVLGLGIMMRFNADPRTIMTLQNQIPRVIIAIILITFSYAISGALIDLMWTATYMGSNAITTGSTSQIYGECNNGQPKAPAPVAQGAPQGLTDNPITYVNRIFDKSCGPFSEGVASLANITGGAVGTVVTNLIFQFLGINNTLDQATNDCSFLSASGIGDCLAMSFGKVVGWIVALIVLVILLIQLFKLWFELLKNAVLYLIYTIGAPIWIVFGLIPGRPLGFEKWLRLMFAHIAAFPLVAFMLIFARVISDSFPPNPDPNTTFVPPLIGNPNLQGFGTLLAFGIILLTPTIPNLLREKLQVKSSGMGASIRNAIGSGAAVTGAAAGVAGNRLFRRYDPETGKEAGILRQAAYGKILGMRQAQRDPNTGKVLKDRQGNKIYTQPQKPTLRYRMASRALGGTLGTKSEYENLRGNRH